MADRITITPQELRTSANNFRTKSEEIVEILKYLMTEVNNLESTWDGAAQDTLHAVATRRREKSATPCFCNSFMPAVISFSLTVS